MNFATCSPRVVGTHFFAKYGYDESMKQVSTNLMTRHNEDFWKSVVDVLDELNEATQKQGNPCAALPMPPQKRKVKP